MSTSALKKSAAKLLATCKKKKVRIATAESCTGGLVAATLTDISGASDVFDRGFVTYSNQSKTKLLGVPAMLIKKHGAVSKQAAEAMAKGALKNSDADVAVAITGIAGPTGGTKTKPVGLVYIALARCDVLTVEEHRFKGNRSVVRRAAVKRALELLKAFSS